MIRFVITPDGGEPFEVEAGSRDVLRWEKVTKGSLQKLMSDLRMTDMYSLAFLTATRTGQFTGSSQEFEATCEVESAVDEEPDPTKPEASDELS